MTVRGCDTFERCRRGRRLINMYANEAWHNPKILASDPTHDAMRSCSDFTLFCQIFKSNFLTKAFFRELLWSLLMKNKYLSATTLKNFGFRAEIAVKKTYLLKIQTNLRWSFACDKFCNVFERKKRVGVDWSKLLKSFLLVFHLFNGDLQSRCGARLKRGGGVILQHPFVIIVL